MDTQEREKSGSACRFGRGRTRRRERRAEVRVGLEEAEHAGERKVWKCVSVWKGQSTQEREKSGSACRFRRDRARRRERRAEVRVGLEETEHAGERRVWGCVSVLKGQSTQEREKSGGACWFGRGRTHGRDKIFKLLILLEFI